MNDVWCSKDKETKGLKLSERVKGWRRTEVDCTMFDLFRQTEKQTEIDRENKWAEGDWRMFDANRQIDKRRRSFFSRRAVSIMDARAHLTQDRRSCREKKKWKSLFSVFVVVLLSLRQVSRWVSVSARRLSVCFVVKTIYISEKKTFSISVVNSFVKVCDSVCCPFDMVENWNSFWIVILVTFFNIFFTIS